MYIKTINLNDKAKRRIAIICGMHGNESNAVKTTLKVKHIIEEEISHFNNSSYKGNIISKLQNISSITFVMGVNRSGLINNVRECIPDIEVETDDLNRKFKFKEKEDVDYTISEIEKIIECNNIVIDVHNSPFCKTGLYFSTDNKLSNLIDAAKKSDLNYIVSPYCPDGVLKNYVNHFYNKIGLTLEINGMGIVSKKEEENNINYLLKLLYNLDNFKSEVKVSKNIYMSTELISPSEGILLFKDDEVIGKYFKGEKICDIVDFDYKITGEIIAPFDGTLFAVRNSVYISAGQSFGTFMGTYA